MGSSLFRVNIVGCIWRAMTWLCDMYAYTPIVQLRYHNERLYHTEESNIETDYSRQLHVRNIEFDISLNWYIMYDNTYIDCMMKIFPYWGVWSMLGYIFHDQFMPMISACRWTTLVPIVQCVADYIVSAPWWRHQTEKFSALLAICVGNSPVAGEFPAQSQWRGALMFSLICVWMNGWVNNREAGDLASL